MCQKAVTPVVLWSKMLAPSLTGWSCVLILPSVYIVAAGIQPATTGHFAKWVWVALPSIQRIPTNDLLASLTQNICGSNKKSDCGYFHVVSLEMNSPSKEWKIISLTTCVSTNGAFLEGETMDAQKWNRGIFAAFIALMTFSTLVSKMTSLMSSLNKLKDEETEQFRSLAFCGYKWLAVSLV